MGASAGRASVAWLAWTSLATLVGLGIVPEAAAARGHPPVWREVEGELHVYVVDDLVGASSQVLYEVLPDGAVDPVGIDFRRPPGRPFITGDRVWVRGRAIGPDRMEADDVVLMAPKQDGSGGGGGSKKGNGGGGSAAGARSAAVILIELNDGAALLDRSEAEEVMWGAQNSVRDLYAADSRGATDFVADADGDGAADVFGPYRVPEYGTGRCDYRSWGASARDIAALAGDDLAGFDHYVYVLSEVNACPFGGAAELGGDELWLNSRRLFAFAHEIGHNLGMQHAGDDPENDGVVNSAYGDGSCTMGGSYRNVLLNGPHADQMGYLGGGTRLALSGAPETRTAILQTLDSDPALVPGTRIVTIPKQDEADYYYLSFRGAGSYDVNLSTAYRGGVSVHRYAGEGSAMTVYLGTLGDGESFVDERNGVFVTQLAGNGLSEAIVEITVTETCGARRPEVTVVGDPSGVPDQVVVGPREIARYAVTVTDLDDPGCEPTTYASSLGGLPSGMTWRFEPPTVVLAPGESTVVVLEVDSGDAADGTTPFEVSATDVDGLSPDHGTDRDYGRITIDRTTTRPEPPGQPSGYSYSTKGKIRLVLEWPASPSAEVVRYHIGFASGATIDWLTAVAASPVSFLWPAGTYTFHVAAEGGGGKMSSPSPPVTLTLSKGGSK